MGQETAESAPPGQGPAIDEALLDRWRRIPVSIAVDLAPECQVDPLVRPLLAPGRQPALFARALTVHCTPPDFGAVLHALARIRPGEVLVIDAGGSLACAVIGDVLGGHLHRLGAAGIVCDGAVRDVATLAGMASLSVYTRGVNPRGPSSASGGAVGGTVHVGGRRVEPGDVVIGDDDGLAVLGPEHLVRHIAAAETKLALEAVWRERLASGEPVTDIFGLGGDAPSGGEPP